MTERSTVTTSPYTIGVAPFRPGDEPTFGGKFTEQPEDLNRPDPATCTAEDTAPHAKGLIRVLTDEGEAPVVVGEIVAKDTVAEPGQAVFA